MEKKPTLRKGYLIINIKLYYNARDPCCFINNSGSSSSASSILLDCTIIITNIIGCICNSNISLIDWICCGMDKVYE